MSRQHHSQQSFPTTKVFSSLGQTWRKKASTWRALRYGDYQQQICDVSYVSKGMWAKENCSKTLCLTLNPQYYKLVGVHVHPVSGFIPMEEATGSSSFIDQLRELEHADTSVEASEESQIKVLTHIWDMPINDLSEEVWAFDRFVREKITIWLWYLDYEIILARVGKQLIGMHNLWHCRLGQIAYRNGIK